MTFHDPRAGCMGKVRYHNEGQAKAALERMRPKMFRHRWKKFTRFEPQEQYHCDCCKGWHTGSALPEPKR
jgi:hypothetical protein